MPQWCLSYGTGGLPEVWTFTKGGARRTVKAGEEIVSNNGDFLRELVLGGGGIAALPDFIAAEDIEEGRVEELLPDWQVQPLWLTLFYPPYEQLPPLVATFSDFFESYLRDVDGMDFAKCQRAT